MQKSISIICLLLFYLAFDQLSFGQSTNSLRSKQNNSIGCNLLAQLEKGITLNEFKNKIGKQYNFPINLVGKQYRWVFKSGDYFYLGFYNTGKVAMIFGKVPPEIAKSVKDFTITLQEAEKALGVGTVSGYIYRIDLPNNQILELQTNQNSVIRGYSLNSQCTNPNAFDNSF